MMSLSAIITWALFLILSVMVGIAVLALLLGRVERRDAGREE